MASAPVIFEREAYLPVTDEARARSTFHAELIRRWQIEGDLSARNTAVEAVHDMVMAIARKTVAKWGTSPMPGSLSALSVDDLTGEIWAMVINGANTYNPNKGGSWTTYCAHRILAAARHYTMRHSRLINIPSYLHENHGPKKQVKKQFLSHAGVGVSVSLHEPVRPEERDQMAMAWLRAGKVESRYRQTDDAQFRELLYKRAELSPLQQRVFEDYYQNLGDMSNGDIAKLYGFSAQRLGQIVKGARQKLLRVFPAMAQEIGVTLP